MAMMDTRHVARSVFSVMAGIASCCCAGCSLDLLPNLPTSDRIEPGANLPPDPGPIVTVWFVNLAETDAVDVEFFVTNEPLDVLPEDLFAEENAVTRNIGVAGTGIIAPRQQDVIEFPCTENLTIGTMGGAFIDNETGDLTGHGTARWAQDVSLGLCGALIVLRYTRSDATFETTISIER